jgi:hypothetical protein
MTAAKENEETVALSQLADGRQSPAAAEIARGAVRLLARHGLASVAELPLPNGRRADLVALTPAGDLWILEIKSCLEDFRADQKWPDYRGFCDRLYFAVKPDFPLDALPAEAGLVLADRYGGEIVREAPLHRLAAARRKTMTLRFARAGALRLSLVLDPPLSQVVGAEG